MKTRKSNTDFMGKTRTWQNACSRTPRTGRSVSGVLLQNHARISGAEASLAAGGKICFFFVAILAGTYAGYRVVLAE